MVSSNVYVFYYGNVFVLKYMTLNYMCFILDLSAQNKLGDH